MGWKDVEKCVKCIMFIQRAVLLLSVEVKYVCLTLTSVEYADNEAIVVRKKLTPCHRTLRS
jgi:hypothetical protein